MAASRDVVVIGASAGGMGPLKELLAHLPASLPAALLVVVHRTLPSQPGEQDFLPELLRSASKLTVSEALDGSELRRAHVHVAPPRSRLVIAGNVLHVEALPTQTGSHHTIDDLLRSAAESCGERVVAILLSGMLSDGSTGLREVSRRGGITIVQDPVNALEPSMPSSAMKDLAVHYCLKPPAIAQTLVRVCRAIPEGTPPAKVLIVEDERIAALNLEGQLRDLGYDVIGSISSGEEAISFLETRRPEIVLMDVHLAGTMTGIEAGAAAWERHRIPVVYVTAYSDQETVSAATQAMPYGFVVKPYRVAQVHAALQLALARRARELQVLPPPPRRRSR